VADADAGAWPALATPAGTRRATATAAESGTDRRRGRRGLDDDMFSELLIVDGLRIMRSEVVIR